MVSTFKIYLIQKIENHRHRHALQSDLQQHRQFNHFSKESRDVIKAAGNTELCELPDVEPKAQCKVSLSFRDAGIVYCTCGHFFLDNTKENKKYRKPTVTATGRRGFRVLHRESAQEEMQEKRILEHSRSVHS